MRLPAILVFLLLLSLILPVYAGERAEDPPVDYIKELTDGIGKVIDDIIPDAPDEVITPSPTPTPKPLPVIKEGVTTDMETSSVKLDKGIATITDKITSTTVVSSININGVGFAPSSTKTADNKITWDAGNTKVEYEYTDESLKERITLGEPTALNFPLSLGAGQTLTPLSNGDIRITSGAGNWWTGTIIKKPFGVDATGKHIEMRYDISGTVLFLDYDTKDIIYPLVIDPTYIFGGVTFNKVFPVKLYGTADGTIPVRWTIHNVNGVNSTTDLWLGSDINANFNDIRFANEDASTVLPAMLNAKNNSMAEIYVDVPITTTGTLVNVFYNSTSVSLGNYTEISSVYTGKTNPYFSTDTQRVAFDSTTGDYLAPDYPYTETFTEESRYAQMVSVTTGTTWVAAASGDVVFSGGAATLASDDDKYVNIRLRSYKEGSGGYEFAFDDNGDGGGGDSYNGNIFAMQDINNFYNAVIYNGTTGSRFELWRIKAGTWSRLGTINANATYVKGDKTWVNVTYDNTRGVIRANYRTDGGAYNSSPDITDFDTSFKYGYSGVWAQVATAGAGNLNVAFSDLSWHTESLVGETNIPAYENNFVFSDDFSVNSIGRYRVVSGAWTINGGQLVAPTGQLYLSQQYITAEHRFTPTLATGGPALYYYFGGYRLRFNQGATTCTIYLQTAAGVNVGTPTVWTKTVNTGTQFDTYVRIVYTSTSVSIYDGANPVAKITEAVTIDPTANIGFYNNIATQYFDDYSITGTRYYMKPMLRGGQGEYWNGTSTVRATRYTADMDYNILNELIADTDTTLTQDITAGEIQVTGAQAVFRKAKVNNLKWGYGFYSVDMKTLSTAVSSLLFFGIDGSGNGYAIRKSSITSFGIVKIVSGVVDSTLYGYTGVITPNAYDKVGVLWLPGSLTLFVNGINVGAASDSTYTAAGDVYFASYRVNSAAPAQFKNLNINALESTSTDGAALGIGGIAHGGRYDTNEYVGVNFTETTPNTYYKLSVPAVSTNATYDQTQNQLNFIDQTGTSFSNTTAAVSRAFNIGTGATTRSTLGWDSENLTTTTNQNYYTFINYTKWVGSAYDDRRGMVYVYPAIAESFFSPTTPTPLPVNGSVWANWTSNVTSGLKPLAVQFTDQSAADPLYPITTWNWTLEPGVYSDAQNPTYTYVTNGTKSVTLRVNNTQQFDNLTKTIFVGDPNSPPIAAFTSNVTTICMYDYVQFTDTSDMTGGGLPESWFWLFGDSGDSHIQNPTHLYDTEGTYTVILEATNKFGSNTTTRDITVTNCYNANFTANQTCAIGKPQVVSLNGTCYGGVALGKASWLISPNESWSYWDGSTWTSDFDGSFNGDDNHDYNATINFTSYGAYTITRSCNFGAPIGIISETKFDYVKIGVNGTVCRNMCFPPFGSDRNPLDDPIPYIIIGCASGLLLSLIAIRRLKL